MARAAVRAKQAQQAQAQASVKPSRKQRKHASGGNPNQDLFFSRLRRKQKWVFLGLAIVFAVAFAGLGVGSGTGAGLDSLYNGIFGGSDPVGAAKAELKTNPAKGYKDLASAYVTKNDLTNAIDAMRKYLRINKTNGTAWTQVAGWETQQANTYATQYQQVLQATRLQAPGSIFQPTGTLASQLGSNPVDDYYSKQNQTVSGPLYQKAIDGYNASLSDFQIAAKYAKHKDLAAAEQAVAIAAQNVGKTKVALAAWQKWVDLNRNSPQLKQIEARCKQLGGSCAPTHKKK